MLRSLNDLRGYAVHATDGDLGPVRDFLFDDHGWHVRYLVVDTGKWLPGRKVLVSPTSAVEADWTTHRIATALTKQQVEESPDIDTEKPVSREMEEKLIAHYSLPVYWGPMGMPATMSPKALAQGGGVATETHGPALRSAKEVTGYYIETDTGNVGHVEDFIVNDGNWKIQYMVVDTRNWLPGRKVLVAPDWIESVRWTESTVHVNLTSDEIKDSPEYDPSSPVNREYEARLYDYYGRPKYWT
jgi:hypothetical protein